jgi:hypothetical protein
MSVEQTYAGGRYVAPPHLLLLEDVDESDDSTGDDGVVDVVDPGPPGRLNDLALSCSPEEDGRMGSTNDGDTRPRRRGAAFVGFMFTIPQTRGGGVNEGL